MIKLEVNGREIEAQEGETLLTALRRAGIHVPTLCYMENLFPSGACRMCVVEIEGMRGLSPSCAVPVAAGMKVTTHSPRAVAARKTIIELLLADHPDDCLYCVRNANCELQNLAAELGVRDRRFAGKRSTSKLDTSSPSLVRDPDKCILCGKCVRTCEEIMDVAAIDFIGRGSRTVVGTAFDQGLNVSTCIGCGQCITCCPTGALHEQSSAKEVHDALNDPKKIVVVQHAPAVSVSLGEEFGLKPGADVNGLLVAALRRLGFNKVFDTSFSADVTIMEEASELVERIKTGGRLPMFTSCSPGWIRYVEQFKPDFIPNLSTTKSPQQILGALIKNYFAAREGIAAENVFSVSIMPCTAKKSEAQRPEMASLGAPDVDAVLTTRELARMIRKHGLDLNYLEPEVADNPFGERSGAGKIFGTSGGVMEAALRTAHFMLTGKELTDLTLTQVRGSEGVRKSTVSIAGLNIGVAVVSGLGNANRLLKEIAAGRSDLHFVEVMTCPGGCVAGGGQPLGASPEKIKARMLALYRTDRESVLRTSHSNEQVKRLYQEFLGEPLSEKSHALLHTHYHAKQGAL